MDAKSLFLTANADTIYFWVNLNVTQGPLVVDTPPLSLGVIDDMWFRWVTDFGLPGPDRGEGGRYLLVANCRKAGTSCTSCAQLPPPALARELDVTESALAKWRVNGEGPPFYKLDHKLVRYPRSGVEAWKARRLRKSTSDPGGDRCAA